MAWPRWIAFADARYPITSRGDRRGRCLVLAHTDEGALVWPEEIDITPETVLCIRCLSQRFVPEPAMTQGGVVEQTGGRGFSRSPPAARYIGVGHAATRVLKIPARDHLYRPNLVARLTLPNMAYAPEDKLLVYAQAVRGLIELEPSTEKRLKYLDFVDIYADLDDHERQLVGRVSAA